VGSTIVAHFKYRQKRREMLRPDVLTENYFRNCQVPKRSMCPQVLWLSEDGCSVV